MANARLALAEALLRTADPICAAQAVADWLVDHAGADQALCVARLGARLCGLAGRGVTPAAIRAYDLDPEDGGHPVVDCVRRAVGSSFVNDAAQGAPPAPLGPGPVDALPLLALGPAQAVGALLVQGGHPRTLVEARWVASVLGPSLRASFLAGQMDHARDQLALEHSQLSSIINSVADPILLTDLQGNLLVTNERAETLFVAREDVSEGRQRAIALNNMLFSSALSQRRMGDTELRRLEIPLVDPSEGSDLLFELITSEVQNGGALVSVLRNVTDLRHATEEIEQTVRRLRAAEAQSRAERDRLDLVIDSVADPIIVTDPSGNLILTNPPAERLLAPPTRGRASAQRFVRANDAHFSSFVSSLLLSGMGMKWSGEVTLTDPETGAAVPFEALAGKIVSETGELTAIVTILHDRTEAIEKGRLYDALQLASRELEQRVADATQELMRQNELLSRQQVALEQASQLKSMFLANVSHEFRTPLNAILGYTSMLLAGVGGSITPLQTRNLSRVGSNARHLLAIINDILDISKIEAGKMPVNLSSFTLGALIEEVVAELSPLVQPKLKVATSLAGRLPKMFTDRAKVKQIVLNLLSNALKFTPEGSVVVTVRHRPGADRVVISVRDTGIGIAPEDHERVFEDFRQVDSTPTRQYGGTGLGLAICKRLAAMLGGQIGLVSQPGAGSTFTLVVPRRRRRP